MHTEPLISIALCTYNGEKYLREQLDSVLTQSYDNFELIIVDDRSTDETMKILKSYSNQDSRIKLTFNEKNLGYTKNFEKALKLCSSEFLAICDQDDIWHPEKLRLQMSVMQNNLLIYHDSELIGETGNPLNYKISDKFNFYKGNSSSVFLYLNCVSGHSILMRSRVLEAALPFPAGYHYDQWLAFTATRLGSIDFVDQCLVKYRQHEHNSTDLMARNTKGKQTSSINKIKKLWLESDWLKLCAEKFKNENYDLVSNLFHLSVARNNAFFYLPYAFNIWLNRKTLLFLLKKNTVSKFFFTLRKAWGKSSRRFPDLLDFLKN